MFVCITFLEKVLFIILLALNFYENYAIGFSEVALILACYFCQVVLESLLVLLTCQIWRIFYNTFETTYGIANNS